MKKLFFLAAVAFLPNIASSQKMKASFDHIGILVNDLDKSRAFYLRIIQLDTIPNPWPGQRTTWFSLGDHLQFHLMEEKEKKFCIPLFNHLCFSVSSVDAFIEKLNQEHIEFTNAEGKPNAITNLRADNVKQIFLKDPDGYVVEINDRKH